MNDFSAQVDACIHCGFCLPSCPTYQLWGQEMDSPRGRIELMRLGLEGESLTDTTVTHMDRCLGCMACVSACPSGVQYDVLITAKRSQVEENVKRPLSQRLWRGMIFGLFPYPRRLRLLRWPLHAARWLRLDRLAARNRMLRRLAPQAATMAELTPRRRPAARLPEKLAAVGKRRAVVGMLTGCVQREFFPTVNAATARVLAAEGCDVVVPRTQGCCGALSGHSGQKKQAVALARATIATFEQSKVDAIVVNSAGCGSAMKEYVRLLDDDPQWRDRAAALSAKVYDFSQYLAELGGTAPRHQMPLSVVYQDACHLAHAQNVREQPRRLLHDVPGVTVLEIGDGEVCCGSAGVYNLLQPDAGRELGDRKADAVSRIDGELLVSSNPGCAMQISAALRRQGKSLPVAHIAEVLDVAIRNGDTDELTGDDR